jgi:TIR domain
MKIGTLSQWFRRIGLLAAPDLSRPGPKSAASLAAPDAFLPSDRVRSSTDASSSPRVFICYRREDTQDASGRLRDDLADAYGPEHVFMDIDSIPLGIDFVEYISDQICRCSAVIVVIGNRWLKLRDKGRRRLNNPDDPVRAEIAVALRQGILVIPVLVQGAKMPRAEQLPQSIKALPRRNGIDLSGPAWKAGMERLRKDLDRWMAPKGSGSLHR